MIEVLCNCNWGIAGVESLPYHSHRRFALAKRSGRDIPFKMMAHDVVLNPGLIILDEWEEILIHIDWKKVYQSLDVVSG